MAGLPTDPDTGHAMVWARHENWHRLRLDAERRAIQDMDLGGLDFDDAVKSGQIKMPCSTTPAADENGRPAPKGAGQDPIRRT